MVCSHLRGMIFFEAATEHEPDLTVHFRNVDTPIGEFLNEELPIFLTSDLSSIEGTSIFHSPTDLELIGADAFEVIDWHGAGVDIEMEKPDEAAGRSIFEWLEERLLGSDARLIFCDDGAGRSRTLSL